MKLTFTAPLSRLHYHVSGAIMRGEKQAIEGIPALISPPLSPMLARHTEKHRLTQPLKKR